MTNTVDSVFRVSDSLVAYKDYIDLKQASVWFGGTTYPVFQQFIQNTLATVFVSVDPVKTRYLYNAYEELSKTKRDIVSSLTIPSNDPSWLTTKEFTGIATDSCVEFCNSHGIVSTLRKCLYQIKSGFSNIIRIKAELDWSEDYENENDAHVVIRLEVKSNREQLVREYDQWVDWVVANLSPDQSIFFTITTKRI
jgi:hypothetical protein